MNENPIEKSTGSITVPGINLTAKLAWLNNNIKNNSSYILEVKADESIGPQNLSYEDKSNITIILKGIGENKTISLSSKGALFTIGEGITLVLDNHIILQGIINNENALVEVSGNLIMNMGSAIIKNNNIGIIFGEARLAMAAGGVLVLKSGILTMNGGLISDNSSGNNGVTGDAGGVSVFGTFIMNDGIISDNTARMNGGVDVKGAFIMNGGTISGNTAYGQAGGVGVKGTFDMKGGTISGNTAIFDGACGGGIAVTHSRDMSLAGKFNKTGGTIIAYASDTVNGNVAKDGSGNVRNGSGHAVAGFNNDYLTKFKDTTADPTLNMTYDASNGDATGEWDVNPKSTSNASSRKCYIATCVYGSYDCPEVWTLRRFRDNELSASWFGKVFIQIYYVVSPIVVELFGNRKWFGSFWKPVLNKFVCKLQQSGIDSSPYSDV